MDTVENTFYGISRTETAEVRFSHSNFDNAMFQHFTEKFLHVENVSWDLPRLTLTCRSYPRLAFIKTETSYIGYETWNHLSVVKSKYNNS